MFAERLCARVMQTEAPYEIFAETGLVTWPKTYLNPSPATVRYMNIEDEILDRTFAAVQKAIAEEFTKIAREVIERERRRQRRGRRGRR